MTRKELENTPNVNDVLQFGKYKGRTVLEVIDTNPSYIVWCIQNVKDFVIDKRLSDELVDQYERHQRRLRNDSAQINSLMDKCGMHASEAIDYIDNCEMEEHF